jgi:hypothetical protein
MRFPVFGQLFRHPGDPVLGMDEFLHVDVDGFRPGRWLFRYLLQQAGLAGTARREEQDVFGFQTSLKGGDYIVARE